MWSTHTHAGTPAYMLSNRQTVKSDDDDLLFLSRSVTPHRINDISHLYLLILIFQSNSTLIDASDTKHTQTFLCFVGNLTPHTMELLAQVRTAALLGHPQIGSLVIWSLGLTGGWREFGFDCWNEMLFETLSVDSAAGAVALQTPSATDLIKAESSHSVDCKCCPVGIWVLEYELLKCTSGIWIITMGVCRQDCVHVQVQYMSAQGGKLLSCIKNHVPARWLSSGTE